jgi:orotate phosphoribosyltransferase
MDESVSALLSGREGHFLFESGHHGHLWLDVDGAFWNPELLLPLADALADRVNGFDPEVLCGPVLGGALLAYLLADRLGLPFVAAQRHAPRPGQLYSARYVLPVTQRRRLQRRRVAIVDDVINAGSAVRSTMASVREYGGRPVVIAALLRLGDAALSPFVNGGVPVETLSVRAHALWLPTDCPLCAQGQPLHSAVDG